MSLATVQTQGGVKPVQRAKPAKAMKAVKQPPRRGRPPVAGAAIKPGSGLRGQCWWLMRELKSFTINQLLETYATGEEKDAHNNLDNYLFRLEAVGVVQRLARRLPGDAPTSPGCVVWRLARDLGPLAPVWRRAQKVVWDPNAGCAVLPLSDEAGVRHDR